MQLRDRAHTCFHMPRPLTDACAAVLLIVFDKDDLYETPRTQAACSLVERMAD
jgi:hypothetical protein